MENNQAKYWWLYSLTGLIMFFGGIWIIQYPVNHYVALGVFFSILLFSIGILEILYSLANTKRILSWEWILLSGIFNMILGVFLMSDEALTMTVLPFIFGIWLAFTGVAQIGRALLLRAQSYRPWKWMLAGGMLTLVFSIFVIYHPLFGAISIIIWTSVSFMLIGIFTIIYSIILKKTDPV